MAMLKDTIVATAPIACPADKFFNLFKNNMSDIVNIFPASFKSAVLIEGEEGTVGCVKKWIYALGGIELTATVRTEAIDDEAKSITFVVLSGDVMQVYTSFGATLTVSTGSAAWSIVYEKASIISPPPELYATLVVALCAMVDTYLLSH